jgi:hypothetical protein
MRTIADECWPEKPRQKDAASRSNPRDAIELDQLVLQNLLERLPKLYDRVDQYLQHGFLSESGGFCCLSTDDNPRRSRLAAAIHEAARAAVTETLKETDLDDIFRLARLPAEKLDEWIAKQLKAARPHLLECGGAARLLVSLPERSTSRKIAQRLESEYGAVPNIIRATAGDLAICYEVEQLPLSKVTVRLIENRPDCVEYASRLHTRIDVDWCPLTSLQ